MLTGKKRALNLERAIWNSVCRNVRMTDIAQKYEITQSTLSTILENASKIDAILGDDVGSGDRKRIQSATYGDTKSAMYKQFGMSVQRTSTLSDPSCWQRPGIWDWL